MPGPRRGGPGWAIRREAGQNRLAVQGTKQDVRDHLSVHVRPLGRDERADMAMPEAVDGMVVPVAVLRWPLAGGHAFVRGCRLGRSR